MKLGIPSAVIVRFGRFEVNLRNGTLHRDGRHVKLQDKPFGVLVALLERPGELVTRDELRERLWPPDIFVIFDDNLNTAVKKLRNALEDTAENPRFIETVPRHGYRFVAPVDWVEESLTGTCHPPPARILRLAVLPFENLTGNPAQEYLSDGLTEELITQVAQLRPQSLNVVPRASVMVYKNAHKTIGQIARELRADYVIEGSLRCEGQHVRVSVQLILARDQTYLWSQNYDRDLTGVLDLQASVAHDIVQKVRAQFTQEQESMGPHHWTTGHS